MGYFAKELDVHRARMFWGQMVMQYEPEDMLIFDETSKDNRALLRSRGADAARERTALARA